VTSAQPAFRQSRDWQERFPSEPRPAGALSVRAATTRSGPPSPRAVSSRSAFRQSRDYQERSSFAQSRVQQERFPSEPRLPGAVLLPSEPRPAGALSVRAATTRSGPPSLRAVSRQKDRLRCARLGSGTRQPQVTPSGAHQPGPNCTRSTLQCPTHQSSPQLAMRTVGYPPSAATSIHARAAPITWGSGGARSPSGWGSAPILRPQRLSPSVDALPFYRPACESAGPPGRSGRKM